MNEYEQRLRDRRCEYEIDRAFSKYNHAGDILDKDLEIARLTCEAAQIDAQSRIAYHNQMLLDADDPDLLQEAMRRVDAIRDRIRHLREDRDEQCRRHREWLKTLAATWHSDRDAIKEQYAGRLRRQPGEGQQP